MKVRGYRRVRMDERSLPVFVSGHREHCSGAANPQRSHRARRFASAGLGLLTCRRASTKVGIKTNVGCGGMLRSNLKAYALTAFCADRKAFPSPKIAQVWHAVLIMMHPVHCIFWDWRPRLKCIPEHGTSVIWQSQALPSRLAAQSPGRAMQPSLEVSHSSPVPTQPQIFAAESTDLVNK